MSESEPATPTDAESQQPTRRDFLAKTSTVAMIGGLAGGYGTLGYIGIRFLFPPDGDDAEWQFVTTVAAMSAGDSIDFAAPSGATVIITRQQETSDAEAFIALSNVCPHLGCRVHWEAQNQRFFCPCHNGVFDAEGRATSGPPAKDGQSLGRYPLKVESGLLYVKVPVKSLVRSDDDTGKRRTELPAVETDDVGTLVADTSSRRCRKNGETT
ncbi:MAG: Rieske (2Fe-2S) protein [Planctomycetes bacterium]|nr:Rieske (2Fe-2S) protein [Planctomycetota bacterium]